MPETTVRGRRFFWNRKGTIKPATAKTFDDFSVLPFAEIAIPSDLHFSNEAAADACSIWGIIAAGYPACDIPEIVITAC
jgi:hypothetical protein